ncbi:beta-galactosidase [Maribacter sp. 2304DJ31-5]|uniref:beta-galactosidase n=1 Tax=Maribacter sp. 2304DJ31-5 TaxID=3386273 RepID=UPI0039BC7607
MKIFSYILSFCFIILTVKSQSQENYKLGTITDKVFSLDKVGNGEVFEIPITKGNQNLSVYKGISAKVSNKGNSSVRIEGFLNTERWINSCIYLKPGEVKKIEIVFKRTTLKGSKEFPAMNGIPGGTLWHWKAFDPDTTEKISFIKYCNNPSSVTISNVSAYGHFQSSEEMASKEGFFPFIDTYGQYKHDDWVGKVYSDKALKTSAIEEIKILENRSGPENVNQYGGWLEGPKRKATGHFRVEKIDDKWWIIDPNGYLFWSHGVTGVRFNNAYTRIEGRERFFEGLMSNNTIPELYIKRGGGEVYNFTMLNLWRKYGEAWKEKATEITMKRLKSWGINTFGNWSDEDLYLYARPRVPYTVAVSPQWPRIDGKGFKFPDVFHPGFRTSIAKAMAKQGERTKNDSFCVGYFIDNELSVGGLTRQLLKQPTASPAKKAWENWLKTHYVKVEELNRLWGTKFKNWKQVVVISEAPSEKSIKEIDLFDKVIVDKYYRICMEEAKKVAPDKMYMGSRLHCHYYPDDLTEEGIIRIAAKYCDIVSFNRYRFSAENLKLPKGVDKPIIIGEFHFGALDRGHLHTGLRSVSNQEQRAEAYYNYVKGALQNTQIVGTHWFQYGDQAFSGRGDGENYQIGMVDICDRPYEKLIGVVKQIGYSLYNLRNE